MMSSQKYPWQSGRNDFSMLHLSTEKGASAEVYRHGAHVTSWKSASGKEWLFLSDAAQFERGKAIRGGVPVIFPQFSGFGNGPRHGFVRNSDWQLLEAPIQADGKTTCRFGFQSTEETLAQWPYRFSVEFIIELMDRQLNMRLRVINQDTQAFRFTAALHTYFAVSDIRTVQLHGLEGVRYWDNNGSSYQEDRFMFNASPLTFPDAIDRVFFNAEQPLELIDNEARLQIRKDGFHDVVVWNPGEEATRQLNDMHNDDYRFMLCVEAAVVDHPIELQPGDEWSGSQTLTEM